VALAVIDRAERRNAVDIDHVLALRAITDQLGDARVLVLAGAGGNFCAGADLSGVEDAAFVMALRGLLDALRALPIVVIAAVEGVALGAGMQLAIACDLRVATPDSRFGIPAAKLGLMVDHWTVGRLASMAGHGPARAMLLAAEVLDGERASELGLVQRRGGLDEARAWADEIADLAPLTIAGHKLALERLEAPPDDDDVRAAFARAWGSDDLAEGVAAFREKRPPNFRGA
jgi:enoyl-CoA hydratase